MSAHLHGVLSWLHGSGFGIGSLFFLVSLPVTLIMMAIGALRRRRHQFGVDDYASVADVRRWGYIEGQPHDE